MAYKRVVTAMRLPQGEELTQAMVGIGMNFAADPAENPNIEDTLIAASKDGMEKDDLRVLSVLVNWLGTHHPWINVDRLIRALSKGKSTRVQAFWTAIAMWLNHDRRFTRLKKLYKGPRINLLRVGTEFQIERRGEDSRFQGTILLVPAGILRERPTDVLSPRDLADHHSTYRERVYMGPSYRADMWAILSKEPALTASELARYAFGSYATAWRVINDYKLLKA